MNEIILFAKLTCNELTFYSAGYMNLLNLKMRILPDIRTKNDHV